MTTPRTTRTIVCAALAVALSGGLLASTQTASASSADGPSERRAKPLTRPTTGLEVPNPGLIQTPEGWVMLNTGNTRAPGLVSRAPAAAGPWTRDRTFTLLSATPKWAGSVKGVWAPSIVRASDGRYVAYYSAPVKGTKGKRRCIGTAYNDTGSLSRSMAGAGRPAALFKPRNKPLVCYSGSGTKAPDSVSSKTANGIIDATPAVFGSRTYLTYKTQKRVRGQWLTTNRLVRLDPARPDRKTLGKSRQMTRWLSPSIEENPILVKRGKTYTLFTSRGWFRQCTGRYPYHTVYRQTKNLKRWPRQPKKLRFNAKVRTCGKGNATVNADGAGWLFTWNGHYPRSRAGKSAPKSLYVGRLAWRGGKPKVRAVLRP